MEKVAHISTGKNQTPADTSGKLRTLAIDVGGTGIKTDLLDESGQPISERLRLDTPHPATPEAVLKVIEKLAKEQGDFERVSVGFPGVVKSGVVHSAHNLDPQWVSVNLEKRLEARLHRPVRVCNDADVQGYAVIQGRGVEMVLTLGTGVGSALFVEGRLVPNLELGHHPAKKNQTYEDRLGRRALDKVGKKRWNRRLQEAIVQLAPIFNYDRLYLGGGNAKFITLDLPHHIKVVSNMAGLVGGIALWRERPAE